ncbi:MAG: orotidine-5'-phosphate decarboxylase [Deltaproteobacteria bacterium]|nr:orotidine-5'-phosphate decarboxylase [Deltaproteobacteria bacterium]
MKPPIAFALDFATVPEARAAARTVAPAIGMIKVGLELFVHAGPTVVDLGREVGLPVFLDLKLHDIPETVERAVAQAAMLGARAITVHASGGRTMLRRAVERAQDSESNLDVCAVTVLTSLDDADLDDIGVGGSAKEAAVRLAAMAYEEGVRWFVCSPAEVRALRERLGKDAVLVTPGVRPASSAKGDQKRVATPEQAIADGASWVVIGRPIRDAADRLAAARAIGASIASVGATA